jgi:hypothetical protein
VTTDKRSVLPIRKEVRATRRVLLLAIVVAVLLIAAAPASAFNGYRADYLTATDCQVCHPDTYAEWAETEHASVEGNNIPIHDGPRCAGCHAGNYDPQKAVPLSGSGTRPDPYLYPTDVAADGGAFSEAMVGCSTCHYGDAASTQHVAPASALANADICGQCHAVNGSSKPPNDAYPLASPTPGGVLNLSYPVGYNPLGTPEACGCGGWLNALPLTDVLNVPTPDVPINQNYYQITGETPTTLMWAAATHTCCTVTGSGLQYEEWALEGHADALKSLKAVVGPNPPAECLKCHSQDFRMAPDDAKPTGAETKYGVTCTSCHDPHEESAQGSVWNEDRDPQLTATRGTLCGECHQAELGWTAAKAGSTVHHPMREMMNGSGGVGVTRGKPSVHRGKCVQCHMPPTGWDRHGLVSATGANHTFTIIEPAIADQALTTKPLGDAGTQLGMPYSACTTCHGRPNDRPAMWLQGTIDARQKAIRGLSTKVRVALEVAARHLHYKSVAAANVAINKKPVTRWTKDQMAFQRAFTNRSFVVSEGSWGIHNYSYARAVITKALAQARSVYR